MPSPPKVVPPGAGKKLNILGDLAISIATGADTNGAYAIGQQVCEPGHGPPLHRHTREDEAFLVLEGEFDVQVGDQKIRATPGTYVFGPRGIPHTFRCVGTKTGCMQVIISPPGLEKFFEELDDLTKQGSLDVMKVGALARRYGLEMLGPPPR